MKQNDDNERQANIGRGHNSRDFLQLNNQRMKIYSTSNQIGHNEYGGQFDDKSTRFSSSSESISRLRSRTTANSHQVFYFKFLINFLKV